MTAVASLVKYALKSGSWLAEQLDVNVLWPIITILFSTSKLTAQVNPTTVLLRGTSAYGATADDVDDERFSLPPVKEMKKVAAPPAALTPVKTAKPRPKKVHRPPASIEAATKVQVEVKSAQPEQSASIGQQVKVLLLGDDDDIQDFKKQISPLDRRNNTFEFAIAPSYFYDSSSSSYSVRRFTVTGPGLSADANLWVSPFLGVHASYFTSLNSTIPSGGTKQNVPADYQNIELGLRFRKHFGYQRKAPSMMFGVDFVQDKMKLPGETSDRVSTSTSGLGLSLHADLPSSNTYSHHLGLELRPRLVHSESSLSNIQSGGKNETNAVGAWIGGDFIFDRRNQIFWKLHGRVEKNTFTGSGTTIDPVTGGAPNGVSVNNTMTIFSLGYKWGN